MVFIDEYSSIKVQEKTEPGNLLEQGWFFGNFLEKKAKMSRCYSDPSSSSNPIQEIQSSSPSPSPSLKKKISSSSTKDHKGRGGLRLNKPNSRTNGLVRAPSLPPYIGKIDEVNFENYDDDDDEESEFTMGRLIRQASLNLSDILPPPNPSKVMKQSCSIPRQQPRKNPEIVETVTNKTTSRDDSESKEVQGFREMGFNFERLNLNPGLGRVEPVHEEKRQGQNSGTPSLPNWVVDDKNLSKDMKAQIKFWARAVASNVRQEC